MASVKPANADMGKLVWTTSDKKIATVDQSGLVTAQGKGRAFITATLGETELVYNISAADKNAKFLGKP